MPTPRRLSTPRLRRRTQDGALNLTMLAVALGGFFLVWAVVSLVLWLLVPGR